MGKRRRQVAAPQEDERAPQKQKPLTQEVIHRIEGWAEEAVENFELLLFDVEVKGGWSIEITIDSKEGATPGKGVTVHQCAEVSRYVEALLDLDDDVPERYTIEVSSPGLERSLTKPRHFAFSVGRQVRIVLRHPLDGEDLFEGILSSYIEEPPSIEVTLPTLKESANQEDTAIAYTLKLSDIAKARLTYDFSGDEG